MVKHDSLWSDLNALLTYLRTFHVVDAVRDIYFTQHLDPRPHTVIEEQIEKLQEHLDNAM